MRVVDRLIRLERQQPVRRREPDLSGMPEDELLALESMATVHTDLAAYFASLPADAKALLDRALLAYGAALDLAA